MEQTKTTQAKESAKAKPVVTRAEKIKRQKSVILSVLEEGARKWNDLLEEATKRHIKLYGEETDVADLKGKIGSALSLLEEERTVNFDEKTNMCSLAAEKTEPKKRGRKKAKESAPVEEAKKEEAEPKKRGRKKKETVTPAEDTAEPKTEASEPKKRGRKKKTEENKPVETEEKTEERKAQNEASIASSSALETTVVASIDPAPVAEKKIEEKTEEKKEEPKKPAWTDVSFFLGNSKKAEERSAEKQKEPQSVAPKKAVLPEFSFLGNAGLKKVEAAEKLEKEEHSAEKASLKEPSKAENAKAEQTRAEQKSEEKHAEEKNAARASEAKPKTQPQQQRTAERRPAAQTRTIAPKKAVSEEEALKTAFLKKLRSLGGEYFEYYSVYLLERYSLKNGRRLEGLKVSGGTGDGGIDGEIELTDKFGFREVIYIQSKNWDPSKGDSEKWTVGETLLQQFIGAVACRQAKERRRKCRGIFVTASRFTDGAREILENMSADFIGYDGDDVFDAAKECEFGLKQVNGKWVLDDKLLSGEKAFFELL